MKSRTQNSLWSLCSNVTEWCVTTAFCHVLRHENRVENPPIHITLTCKSTHNEPNIIPLHRRIRPCKKRLLRTTPLFHITSTQWKKRRSSVFRWCPRPQAAYWSCFHKLLFRRVCELLPQSRIPRVLDRKASQSCLGKTLSFCAASPLKVSVNRTGTTQSFEVRAQTGVPQRMRQQRLLRYAND